jgi:hypothetical protein
MVWLIDLTGVVLWAPPLASFIPPCIALLLSAETIAWGIMTNRLRPAIRPRVIFWINFIFLLYVVINLLVKKIITDQARAIMAKPIRAEMTRFRPFATASGFPPEVTIDNPPKIIKTTAAMPVTPAIMSAATFIRWFTGFLPEAFWAALSWQTALEGALWQTAKILLLVSVAAKAGADKPTTRSERMSKNLAIIRFCSPRN